MVKNSVSISRVDELLIAVEPPMLTYSLIILFLDCVKLIV